MKRILIVLASISMLFVAAQAQAYTCDATGCTFEVDYTNASKLANGQPLTDELNSTIRYTVSVDGGAPGALKTVTVPAASPTGGDAVTQSVKDPTMLPPHTYTVNVTVTDTAGEGTSAPSGAKSLTMNNGVVPNAPALSGVQ